MKSESGKVLIIGSRGREMVQETAYDKGARLPLTFPQEALKQVIEGSGVGPSELPGIVTNILIIWACIMLKSIFLMPKAPF